MGLHGHHKAAELCWVGCCGAWVFLDFWRQPKGRGLHGIMGGVEQILPASFSPTAIFSWGLGTGCTCETPQTFQHIWYVRELCLSKPCIKMAGLALWFIKYSPRTGPRRSCVWMGFAQNHEGQCPVVVFGVCASAEQPRSRVVLGSWWWGWPGRGQRQGPHRVSDKGQLYFWHCKLMSH